MRYLRVGIAQINNTVGDFSGNEQKIIEYIEKARKESVQLLLFPELAICGYPAKDLIYHRDFVEENSKVLERIIPETSGMIVVVGFLHLQDDDIYNAAAIIHDANLLAIQHKIHLPNYGVFDEYRYFQMGTKSFIVTTDVAKLGVNICEDIWISGFPVKAQVLSGAEVIVNISASPFHAGKFKLRRNMLSTRASDNSVFVAFNNLVGGQDELVFDGRSMIIDHLGEVIKIGKGFEEDLFWTDIDLDECISNRLKNPKLREDFRRLVEGGKRLDIIKSVGKTKIPDIFQIPVYSPFPTNNLVSGVSFEEEMNKEIFEALCLGARDYVLKNGFKKVLIGISGGIDSALVAVIASYALGPENVVGVQLPSEFTSADSFEDAKKLAKNLGIELLEIPINEVFALYLKTLAPLFEGKTPDITEENIQSRIRGNILMALSNKFGYLLLATGNKSEASVGYATLYGDMCGGLSVISDIPKTTVYKLCHYLNKRDKEEIIPTRILTKAPSAELKSDQKDIDSLPEYGVLDQILHQYIELDRTPSEIIASGFDNDIVIDVLRRVDKSEFKRKQAAPGIKITPKAFGSDRRFPITNKFLPKL
ncbi:NAD+ synthase [bacterium]|nr:NAD+ synthase [bacterium]